MQSCKILYDGITYECNICNKKIKNAVCCKMTDCNHIYHNTCLIHSNTNQCIICNKSFYSPSLNFARAFSTGGLFNVQEELYNQMTNNTEKITCVNKRY